MDSKRMINSDDTLNPKSAFRRNLASDDDEAGYSPDHEGELALDDGDEEVLDDDDEYYSSSDSDGGLVMSRRRSAGNKPMYSSSPRGIGSLDAAPRSKQRRGTGLSKGSKRSSRSGSNNTMKKVRTRDSEDGRVRMDIEEE